MAYRWLAFNDGIVEYVVGGPEDARELLVFHVGSPAAAVPYSPLTAAAGRHGVRTAIYSRGGYGRSTRRPGRTVADEAEIAAALADRLGHERFFTAGWSGGGPVALACAALLPGRVRGCVVLASLAPWAEVGDEWPSWVADPDDWAKLARGDEQELIPDFEAVLPTFARMTAARIAARYGKGSVERVALLHAAGLGGPLAHSMRRAMSRGFWGWLDDNVAQGRDWGFRVGDIRVPVTVRHGEADDLVDVRHGRWLAAAIPDATSVFIPDAGHGAITFPFDAWVDQLLAAAE